MSIVTCMLHLKRELSIVVSVYLCVYHVYQFVLCVHSCVVMKTVASG